MEKQRIYGKWKSMENEEKTVLHITQITESTFNLKILFNTDIAITKIRETIGKLTTYILESIYRECAPRNKNSLIYS